MENVAVLSINIHSFSLLRPVIVEADS